MKTVHNSLLEALKHNFASIAFPAVSSGIFGVPIHICAKAMMQGIREFLSIDQSAQPKSITIVLLQEHHIALLHRLLLESCRILFTQLPITKQLSLANK